MGNFGSEATGDVSHRLLAAKSCGGQSQSAAGLGAPAKSVAFSGTHWAGYSAVADDSKNV
jgi:hypothetical protein